MYMYEYKYTHANVGRGRGFWVTMDESIFFYCLVLCGTIESTRVPGMGMEAVGDVRANVRSYRTIIFSLYSFQINNC